MRELLWPSTASSPRVWVPNAGGVEIGGGVQDLGFLGLGAAQDGYAGGTEEDSHPGLVCHQDPFVDRGGGQSFLGIPEWGESKEAAQHPTTHDVPTATTQPQVSAEPRLRSPFPGIL